MLTEAYASGEEGTYLISKAWKGQAERRGQGQTEPSTRQGGEGMGKPTRDSWDHENHRRE